MDALEAVGDLGAVAAVATRLAHFGKAQNGVQRRAQLVRHIGQEFGFGAAGFFCQVACLAQCFFGIALGRNILIQPHRAQAGGVRLHGAAVHVYPQGVAVAALQPQGVLRDLAFV